MAQPALPSAASSSASALPTARRAVVRDLEVVDDIDYLLSLESRGDDVEVVDASCPPEPTSSVPDGAPLEDQLISRKRASLLTSQHRSEARAARKAARTATSEGSARAASSSSQGISRVARDSLRPPLPEWVHKSDASHHLLWIGGFLTCSRCAATASVAVQSKSRFYGPCRGTFPPGSPYLSFRQCGSGHYESHRNQDRKIPMTKLCFLYRRLS